MRSTCYPALLAGLIFVRTAVATNVHALAPGPVIELRERLQAVLRGDLVQAPLRNASTLGIGRTRVGLVALEEATKALVGPPDVFRADRINRVLNYAERSLADVELSPADRVTLDGYLTIILRLLRNPRPANVVRMLYQHDAWSEHQLDYLVAQVRSWPGRPHTYRALIGLRARMTEDHLRLIRAHLRESDCTTDALAMLEEFGGLGPGAYATLIKRLEMDLTSGVPNETGYRAQAVEIKLRALDRAQRRLINGDPLIVKAARRAESRTKHDLGREFFRRLRAGQLTIDTSFANLSSSDPLGLRERRSAKVIELASCARRFARSE